jgi:hypothetical protein
VAFAHALYFALFIVRRMLLGVLLLLSLAGKRWRRWDELWPRHGGGTDCPPASFFYVQYAHILHCTIDEFFAIMLSLNWNAYEVVEIHICQESDVCATLQSDTAVAMRACAYASTLFFFRVLEFFCLCFFVTPHLPLHTSAVPFSSVSSLVYTQVVRTDGGGRYCALIASGLQIDSVTRADLLPWSGSNADPCNTLQLWGVQTAVNAWDFSNNSISTLSNTVFADADWISIVDLSRNALTAASIRTFFAASGSSLFGGEKYFELLELSFNNLGPSVPAVFRNIKAGVAGLSVHLSLVSCGIMDVPTGAFAGAKFGGVSWL